MTAQHGRGVSGKAGEQVVREIEHQHQSTRRLHGEKPSRYHGIGEPVNKAGAG